MILQHLLQAHGSDFVEQPSWDESRDTHYTLRAIIKEPSDLNRWVQEADELAHRLEIQSVGYSLEIIKDTGDAKTVALKHNVNELIGTHGLGHAQFSDGIIRFTQRESPLLGAPISRRRHCSQRTNH